MTEEEYAKVEKQRVAEVAQNSNPQVVPTPKDNLTPQDIPAPQEETPAHLVAQLSPVAVLLEKSMEIYKSNFGKMIGMVLLPFLGIIAIVFVVVVFLFLSGSLGSINSAGLMGGMTLIAGLLMIMAFIGIIYLGLIAKAGLYVLVKDSAKQLSFKQAFNEGKKFAIGIWIINMVSAVFIMLWSMLLIIPGLVAALNYSLAPWAYLYEGFTGSKALARSKELIQGYWWAVLGRFAAIVGVYYVVIMIGSAVTGEEGIASIIFAVLTQVLSILIGPFIVIYSCFIYWDLRKIKGESRIQDKKGGGGVFVILFFVGIVMFGLLSTMAIINVRSAQEKARDTMRVTSVNSIRTAVEMYIADNGQPPVVGTRWNDLDDKIGQYIQGGLPSDPLPSRSICYCAQDQHYVVASIAERRKDFSGDIDSSIENIFDFEIDCLCSDDSDMTALNCSDDSQIGLISYISGSVFCIGSIDWIDL